MTPEPRNQAFIDGQNLYMGTAKSLRDVWRIDLAKFRFYLKRKYKVTKAYYFVGAYFDSNKKLYSEIMDSGYILIFREHIPHMRGNKKGNVDSDIVFMIVFMIMKKLYKNKDLDRVVLVSGDGDYKKLVDFLIEENKFEKILFPNSQFASSLYKKLGNEYTSFLNNAEIKDKIKRVP